MTRPRLIPCLLLKGGVLVRSEGFRIHQVVGNPIATVQRLSQWNVDELVLLDISETDSHDLRRDDLYVRYRGHSVLDVLKQVAEVCAMPLAVGGRIRTLDDIAARLAAGADKCIVNTHAVDDPGFIEKASRRFGAQCVVVSIDALRHPDGRLEVFADHGRRATGMTPAAWARRVQTLGAGEIFLNAVHRDGTAGGYDLDLVREVTRAVDIPVIACGGCGRYADAATPILEGGAAAVAAANIFHFYELSYPLMKQACVEAGIPMRPVKLDSRWFPREPDYDHAAEDRRLADRLARAAAPLPADTVDSGPPRRAIRWCARCVSVSISATPTEFDENGVCSGCRTADAKLAIPPAEWERRKGLLYDLIDRTRSRDGSRYDCVIPVSGGKDSYFQTHVIKNEFGFNPLLVTYNGNNYTPAGWRNVHRMKEAFGVDHLFFSPSVETLKKLNRQAFMIMGDMNWHAHVGINSVPIRAAAQWGVPVLIWGESGLLDIGGQFSMTDFHEMNYRNRLEYFGRGFDWNYFVGREGLTAGDLTSWRYPSDRTLFDLGLRGPYLGNYVYWEANDHTEMVVRRYGFETSDEPFDRTYRRMSNLDDMHENGVHDYLKYIKFGYGRATDHACKDIRAGRMTREEGVAMVRRYDHVKPRDLARWLDYVGMSEDEFDRIADTFRDPRVWRRRDGAWIKANIWD